MTFGMIFFFQQFVSGHYLIEINLSSAFFLKNLFMTYTKLETTKTMLIRLKNNAIIKKWKSLGLDVKTSAKTQALIELKNSYCQKKLCLHCRIGNFILKQTEVIDD